MGIFSLLGACGNCVGRVQVLLLRGMPDATPLLRGMLLGTMCLQCACCRKGAGTIWASKGASDRTNINKSGTLSVGPCARLPAQKV